MPPSDLACFLVSDCKEFTFFLQDRAMAEVGWR
jgi:hypothetical protein